MKVKSFLINATMKKKAQRTKEQGRRVVSIKELEVLVNGPFNVNSVPSKTGHCY